MNYIEQCNLKLLKESSLQKALSKYVDFLILKKEIKISSSNFRETALLIKNNIIQNENNFLKIKNYTYISIKLLEHYKALYSFNQSNKFKETIVFYNRIKKEFTEDKYSTEYQILELEILKDLIYQSNKKFNSTFTDFIENFSKKQDSDFIFDFIRAYSEILPFINIDNSTIYDNSILLLKFTKSDENYNIDEGNILNGIKQKCLNDEKIGLSLFHLLLEMDDIENNDIIFIAILSGLYEKIGPSFYVNYLKKLLDVNKYVTEIINALSNTNNIEESDYNLFITLFNEYKTNANLNITLAKLLFAILKSESFNKKNSHIDKCFECLNEILSNENSSYFILQNTVHLKNYDTKRLEILLNIIHQSYFSIDKYLIHIPYFFWKLENVEYLKQVLVAISESQPFKEIAKHFNSRFENFDKIDFDNMLINFLTDSKASLRFLGMNILDNLTYNKFNIDILELEPIKQYKLWVCLTQTYKEPKYIIPFLIPLLDSKSETVKECFICKLKEYSENYGGHLTELLKTSLDVNNLKHQMIIVSINDYMCDYYDRNVHIKHNIKELNPYYSNNKILNDFKSLFNKKMRKGINKGADKNSFLSFCTTVQLAKGGGWKFNSKSEISKLGKIQTSMALPRNYFINPNEYELSEGQENFIDWKKNDFETIEIWIANE